MTRPARNPNWWNERHDTAWDRTKAAFQRDWEQTKADLTGRSQGHDLNQDASDTFRQASGKQVIPPGNFPNTPDDDDMARHARHAERAHDRAAGVEGKAILGQADSAKVADARKDAHHADRMYDVNRALRWSDVEEPIRYGYGAAMQFDREWQDHRDELRRGWGKTYGDRPFEAVHDYVRMGWDRARGAK
jgi:hypothetical protein